MDVAIIRLPIERWREYRALRLRGLREDARAFGSTYAENVGRPDAWWIGRLADAAAGHSLLLFAERDGALAGMIGAIYEDEPGIAAVISVYVPAEQRGHGIGAQLLDATLAALRARPEPHTARLTVNAVQTAAIALYRRAGFATVAVERNRMGDGVEHDELVMERTLEDGRMAAI